MRYFIKPVLMAASLCATLFMSSVVLAGNVVDLPGYSASSVVKAFAAKVAAEDSLYDYLKAHAEVSRKVLSDTTLQAAIVDGEMAVSDVVVRGTSEKDVVTRDRVAHDLEDAVAHSGHGSSAPLPDVTKVIKDPAPTPYIPPVLGSEEKPQPPHIQPPQPVDQTFDINAVTAADNSLDAKGWPKHLKVPSDCPAPNAGTKYYYENRFYNHFLNNPNAGGFGPVGPSQNGALGWNQMQPYHKVGPWFLVGMTDVEQMAIPFHTANTAGYTLELTSETHPVPQTFFQIAYAHCPGDFTNATPAGEETLADMGRMGMTGAGPTVLAIVADKDHPYPSSRIAQLRPNKRYFMNIRPIAAMNPESEDGCDKHFPNITKRDGHSICWRLLVGRANSFAGEGAQNNTAPYAGPCLTEGPYPENYNSETCGESMAKACVAPDEDRTSHDQDIGIDVTCYDPTNKKAPQRFARECSNHSRLSWTVGYRKPAYSDYLCERSDATVVNGICAIHREGQMRERRCTLPQGGDAISQYIEQCVFDRSLGRFHWVKLSNRMNMPNGMSCEVVPYERPLVKDTCQFNGQTYALGTVQNITCHVSLDNRSATMSRTCQKLAVGSASDSQSSAPVFVKTGGDSLPESEISTNRPYSCTFSYTPPGQ